MPTNRCRKCKQPLIRSETICDRCRGGPAVREAKNKAQEAKTPCQFVLRTVGNLPIPCGLSKNNKVHTWRYRLFHPYEWHQFMAPPKDT